MNAILLIRAAIHDLQKRPRVRRGPSDHFPPIGLGYLAAYLLQQGVDVQILDMCRNGVGLSGAAQAIREYRPDIVGISSTTSSYPFGLSVARLAKQIDQNCKVVMGGYHVAFQDEECLANHPEIDAVVRGEGELTLYELFEAWRHDGALSKIAGLSYRPGVDGGVFRNPPRPLIIDLDQIPWPARHLMNLDSYLSGGTITTSRGCPFSCIFCAASALSGRKYRIRRAEKVVDEMEHMVSEYGQRKIDILDDTFTIAPKMLTFPVCREIMRRGLEVAFSCESRVDVVSPQLCDELVRAGCVGIQFGIESGSQVILDATKKGITLEQAREAVRLAKAARIGHIKCSFILGHVHDTADTIRETMLFAEELKALGATEIVFAPMTPFPGTEVYEKREEYGVIIHEKDWSKFNTFNPVISTRNLSLDDLRGLYMEAVLRFSIELPK